MGNRLRQDLVFPRACRRLFLSRCRPPHQGHFHRRSRAPNLPDGAHRNIDPRWLMTGKSAGSFTNN